MDRAERYKELKAEIDSVVAGETSITARYATASCILSQAFSPRFFWTGFYMVDPLKESELVVGPYQGTLGCLRIPFGKGVCGHVAATRAPSAFATWIVKAKQEFALNGAPSTTVALAKTASGKEIK